MALAPWPVGVTVLMEPVPTETPRVHQWRRDRLWFWGCLVHSFPTVSENPGPRQVEARPVPACRERWVWGPLGARAPRQAPQGLLAPLLLQPSPKLRLLNPWF